MKKTKLLALLAVPFILTGCGDKEEIATPKGPKVETRYLADNSIQQKYENTYDKKGNLSETLSTFYSDGVPSKWKNVLEYNGDLLVRENSYSQKDDSTWELKYKSFYYYDDRGNEKIYFTYDINENGEEIPSYIEYSAFNDKNLLIHTESYMRLKSQFYPSISVYYEYNDKGLLIGERHAETYNVSTSIYQNRSEYIYNDDDTLKEVKEYSGYLEDGKIGEEVLILTTYYEYDANKNRISETCHGFNDQDEDEIKTRETYEYDDKNRMVKSSYFHKSDDETATELELDSYTVYEY